MLPAGHLWGGPGAARQSDTGHRSAADPGCSTCSEAACGAPDRKGVAAHCHSGTETTDERTHMQDRWTQSETAKYRPVRGFESGL